MCNIYILYISLYMYMHNPYTLVLMYIYCSTYGKTELPGHSNSPMVSPRCSHSTISQLMSSQVDLGHPPVSEKAPRRPVGLGKRSGGDEMGQTSSRSALLESSLSDCAKRSIFQVRFPGNYYFWPERTSKWHGSWGQKLDRSPATATGHTRMGRLGQAFSSSLMQLGFRAMEHLVPSSVAP